MQNKDKRGKGKGKSVRRKAPIKGGSVASDNVVENVSCDAFETLDSQFTNRLSGGASDDIRSQFGAFKVSAGTGGGVKPFWGPSKKPQVAPKPKPKSKGKGRRGRLAGGDSCNAPAPLNVFNAYNLSSANIPKTLPSPNMAGFDASQLRNVAGSVLDALKAEVAMNQNVYDKVAFPTNMSSLQLSQGGGSPCDTGMCGI